MVLVGLLVAATAGNLQAHSANERSALDAWFENHWRKSEARPALPCEDFVFLRRISLDLTGTLPEPQEIRAFLKSGRKDKRDLKIEELLSSPKAAEYFAYLWVQWLMGHDIEFRDLQRLDLGALCGWLKQAWAEDMPYDDFVWAFLSAAGKLNEHPAANFAAKYLLADEPPAALARAAARLFLGLDIRCAQCHDHPFDAMTHEDFWSFASYFRPLRLRGGVLAEESASKPAVLREDLGELYLDAKFLDGRVADPGEPRGLALARLFLTMGKDAAARSVVDRYWKLYFGRHLLPGRQSKGQPELLDLLVGEFRAKKSSLRALARLMVSSRAYQLSSEGPEAGRESYAVGPLKMMNTVQFMRVWNHAFQWEAYFRQQYEKHPERLPYMKDPDVFWLVRTMQAKELLFPKGRDPEEALASGTDRLAIKLMNNRDIQLMMVAQFGLVQKVMKQTADPGARIEELFLLMVSRPPTKAEKSKFVDHERGSGRPEHAYIDGYVDLFWTLFNSAEFVFVG